MLKIQAEKDHECHERYTFLQQKWHKLENTLQSDIHIRSSRTWMSIYFPLFLRLCDIRGLWSWQSEREKRGVRIPRWRTAYQMTLLVIRLCIWDAHIAIIPRVTTCLWWLVIGQAHHLIFFYIGCNKFDVTISTHSHAQNKMHRLNDIHVSFTITVFG